MPAHFCKKCGRPKAVVGIMDKKKKVSDDEVFEVGVNGQIWVCLKCNPLHQLTGKEKTGRIDD